MTARRSFALIAAWGLAAALLPAQDKVAQFSVLTDYSLALFKVDGRNYYGKATFSWPEGTTHVLEFPSTEGYQYAAGGASRFGFQGWEDSTGLLPNPDNTVQVVVANAAIKYYKLRLEAEYRVKVNFWKGEATGAGGVPPAVCGPPDGAPISSFRPGVVLIGDACLSQDAELWMVAGTYNLAAFPYPGFAFTGWSINDGGPNAFLRTLDVRTPLVVAVYFRPAKRLKFITEPLGLQVLLDRTATPTPAVLPCAENQTLPRSAPPGIPAMCIGEVDWALNSQHVIGATSPQKDRIGKYWVFKAFNNGMENHALYTVRSLLPETITAKFVQGAQVSFLTTPTGLKLTVNGRDNWPSYNFVAAAGDKYTVTAPARQTGPDGRTYVFRGWSNGGEATQEVTVPADAVERGFRITATYEMLGRTLISTEPAGTPVEVDGATCDTPCAIDKPDGTEVRLAAPARRSISHVHRLEFAAWSDGGPRERTLKISGREPLRLTANYTTYYRLETASQPAGGASFALTPASADAFYAKDAWVTVAAKAHDGYRFRRWGGDLDHTYDVATLQMTVPHSLIALLDEVPYIPPAGVRNAAGLTPNEEVAPGSIISIYGGGLAPYLAGGGQNPLPQTIAGVTVEVASRLLALLFVSPAQINAVLPYDLPEGTHRLTVHRDSLADVTGEFKVLRNSPGLFTRLFDERLFVMASHEDGSAVTLESPAARGETIRIYGTGFGPYDRAAPYGFNLPGSPRFTLADPLELFVAGRPVKHEWAGGAAGYAGADVLHLRITDELPAAATVDLKVRINGRESNEILLPLK
ncbi:MAG: hypothetical protein KIT09_07990 [Bryobacteraceae bacterium]|nr:hypothetical protein [Bryobacteraceae bacterium]